MRGHGVKQKIVSPDVPVSSAIIVLGDRPGALEEVLQSFKEHKVNLTHISSRPSKGRCVWQRTVAAAVAVVASVRVLTCACCTVTTTTTLRWTLRAPRRTHASSSCC